MVQAFEPLTLGIAVASLAISAGGVWFSIRLAGRVGVVDVPNERSSHLAPIPRMGGVPMVVATVLAFEFWTFLAVGEVLSIKGLRSVILYALVMCVLGFWDDLSNLSPLFRFLVQFAGASLLLWACVGESLVLSVGDIILPLQFVIPACAVWVVWMVNLYNFMDGIDGIAGGEAAVTSCFFFLVFANHGETGWAVINLFVAAASIGFLIHNWPPARVFMGDAGSAFLGAFFGMQSVVAASMTSIPFLVLVLPFTNFIFDTTATLIRRMFRGEKWYRAHRSHFYQRMTNLGMSHSKVTGVELISVILSCLAATWYLRSGFHGRVVAVAAVLIGFMGGGIWIFRKERFLK
jgi:Fuc2NAc and GlcNAc transferase